METQEAFMVLKKYAEGDMASHLEWRRTARECSDIAGHIDTLIKYGGEVDTICEFGTRNGTSACCWLVAKPKKLTCYDISFGPLESRSLFEAFAAANNIAFSLIEKNDLEVEIEPVDLLFIDTDHTYEQLTAELNLHGDNAGKYIICHDTVYDSGCMKALEDYIIRNPHWRIKEHFTHNGSLTVMERTDRNES